MTPAQLNPAQAVQTEVDKRLVANVKFSPEEKSALIVGPVAPSRVLGPV